MTSWAVPMHANCTPLPAATAGRVASAPLAQLESLSASHHVAHAVDERVDVRSVDPQAGQAWSHVKPRDASTQVFPG